MDKTLGIREVVEQAVQSASVFDMHTHLFPVSCKKLCLAGIDDLLNYHYLIAEALRVWPAESGSFWRLSKPERADWIWRRLFLEQTPVSEACRGVLTTLRRYGLDTGARDLALFREYFRSLSPEEHLERVLKLSGVESLVMTNDPFDAAERGYWEGGTPPDPRFKSALRLDVLLNEWPRACQYLREAGYEVRSDLSGKTRAEIRRFIEAWDDRLNPVYHAVSLPPTFSWPDPPPRGDILQHAVLPVCRERRRPLALMIGVKRGVNPHLGAAGDGLGRANVEAVEKLCMTCPENRFLVTMLSRENQHELAVAARKFGNLMVFGCWWFLNMPSLMREITELRLELLGLDFIPQHSDARVLDQLIYKWDHSREVLGRVLADHYERLAKTGWTPAEDEIKRDVARLFAGNFRSFAGV